MHFKEQRTLGKHPWHLPPIVPDFAGSPGVNFAEFRGKRMIKSWVITHCVAASSAHFTEGLDIKIVSRKLHMHCFFSHAQQKIVVEMDVHDHEC